MSCFVPNNSGPLSCCQTVWIQIRNYNLGPNSLHGMMYAVIKGGGDYVLVVKFSGGDYVLVVKFSGGDYVLVVKFMGGDFVHVYKNEQGGFCPGGIMSVCLYRLHNREMRYTLNRLVSISYFHSQFPFVQLPCKDCYLTKNCETCK